MSTLKDLERRENIAVENLTNKNFEELFELLEKGKIVKESIPDILTSYKIKNPKISMNESIKKLGLETITKKELQKIVNEVIEKNKDKPVGKIIGIVMSKVRGRIKSKDVIEMVKKKF